MIDVVQHYVAAMLVVVGSIFALTASIGLLRLPDLYTRMHAASKAGTLGSCVMLIALVVFADDLAVRGACARRPRLLPADRAGVGASAGQGRACVRPGAVATFRGG